MSSNTHTHTRTHARTHARTPHTHTHTNTHTNTHTHTHAHCHTHRHQHFRSRYATSAFLYHCNKYHRFHRLHHFHCATIVAYTRFRQTTATNCNEHQCSATYIAFGTCALLLTQHLFHTNRSQRVCTKPQEWGIGVAYAPSTFTGILIGIRV
jgi:hypothetical protein